MASPTVPVCCMRNNSVLSIDSYMTEESYLTDGSEDPQVPPIPFYSDADSDPFLYMEDITDLTLGDIIDDFSIELIPFFERENFYVNNNSWLRLQPVLKLASVILSSHRALRFFYTIFFGKLVPRTSKEVHDTLFDPMKGPLSVMQERLVGWVLDVMAKDTRFEFAEAFANPATHRRPDRKARFLAGCGCDIVFPDTLHTLQQPVGTVGAQLPVTKISTLRAIFKLTTDLCHEIAHAAWSYRSASSEPHLAEICGSASELGFACESVLFGGLYETMNVPKRRPLYASRREDGIAEAVYVQTVDRVTSWPVWSTVRLYQDNDPWLMSLHVEHDSYLDLTVRLPVSKLAAFFTKAHWAVPVDETNLITALNTRPGWVDVAGHLEKMSYTRKTRAMQSIAGIPLFHKGKFSLREVDTQQMVLQRVRESVPPNEAQEWLDDVQTIVASSKKPSLPKIDSHQIVGTATLETPEARKRRGYEAIRKIKALREHGKTVGSTISLLEYLLVSAGPAGRLGMLLQKTLKVPVRVSRTILFTETAPYASGTAGNTCWAPISNGKTQELVSPNGRTTRV